MEKITLIIKPSLENIEKAVSILKKGGIIIYPTESSYAIGCDYTNKKAIEQIYKIKKRSKSKHMITILAGIDIAKKYGKINKTAEFFINRFMPGPLTLVVPSKKRGEKFRFRISNNPIASKLAKRFGKPIVATSANISKNENIYDSSELETFFGFVDVILDAGDLPKSKVSTILEIKDKKIKVIREGAITKIKLKNSIKVK